MTAPSTRTASVMKSSKAVSFLHCLSHGLRHKWINLTGKLHPSLPSPWSSDALHSCFCDSFQWTFLSLWPSSLVQVVHKWSVTFFPLQDYACMDSLLWSVPTVKSLFWWNFLALISDTWSTFKPSCSEYKDPRMCETSKLNCSSWVPTTC